MDELHVISTKLIAPVPRKQYICRERLFQKLLQSEKRKLTLIQGTAGSGKTTLITSFMQEFPSNQYRWLSLDEENNDLFSFWYYFSEAIREDLGEKETDFLTYFETFPQKQEIKSYLIFLINQLQQVEKLTVIVDDFHVVKDSQLLDSIEFFIKYSPEHIRIILLTREAPALYLGQLMMGNQYMEIQGEELKFTSDEAKEFFERFSDRIVDAKELEQLIQWTEGWCGGLQLMALRTAQAPSQSLEQVKGSNKYIMNYLSNEIIENLQKNELHFLLKTSIFEYFTVRLCNELLAINTSEQMIQKLVRQNLFIVTIDEKKGVYRYHHLFKEFLQHKRAIQYPVEKMNDLQRRAGKIFQQRNDWELSLKHFLQAGSYKEALSGIKRIQYSITSWVYLQQIPLDVLKEDYELLFQRIVYHLCNLEFETCSAILVDLEDIMEEEFYHLFRFIGFFVDDTLIEVEFDSLLIDKLEKLEFTDVTKALVYVTLSMLLGLRDQYAEAIMYCNKSIQLIPRLENPYIQYFSLSCKAQLLESMGELKECERIYQELFSLIERYSYLAPLSVNSRIGIGGVYMKMMRLEEADQVFQQIHHSPAYSYPTFQRAYQYNLLEVAVLKGNRTEIKDRLKQIRELGLYNEHPLYYSALLKYQLLVDQVEPPLLNRFFEKIASESPKRLEDRLIYIRCLLWQENNALALKEVNRLLIQVRKNQIGSILVEALILKIIALSIDDMSNNRERIHLMVEAIHYSYTNEIAYPFVIDGEKLRPILQQVIEVKKKELNTKVISFIERLSGLIDQSKQPNSLLSNREMDVLMTVAAGLSNREIGEKLHISIATVKTHLINIYSKLDVSNRMEAVNEGRRLGLLR